MAESSYKAFASCSDHVSTSGLLLPISLFMAALCNDGRDQQGFTAGPPSILLTLE